MDENMPLISIIIPVYNVEKYIDTCLRSICCQSYKKLEIILIDDGSSDSSPAKCDQWAEQDHRVRVIHKTNGGVSSARNAGLRVAVGDYISFVDPDDYILDGLYEMVVEQCRNYDMIAFGCYVTNDEKSYKVQTLTKLTATSSHQQMITQNYPKMLGFSVEDIKSWNRGEDIYTNRAYCMVWQFVIKTSILREHDILFKEELKFQEDDIFIMECLMYINSFHVVSEPYYVYVQHPTNLTHSFSTKAELEKKFYLLKFKNTIRAQIIEKDDVDILKYYAGSNVLSIIQVMVLCAENKLGYQRIKSYIDLENVKESVKMVPLETGNIKFNAVLLLLKCHVYRLLYMIVLCCKLLNINLSSGLK